MKYFKNPIISKEDARFNFMMLHWDNTGYIKHISREYIRELKIRLREYCKREGEKRNILIRKEDNGRTFVYIERRI